MLRCPKCLLLTYFICLLFPPSGSAEHQRPHHPSARDDAAVCGEAQPGRSFPHGCWNGTFYRIQKIVFGLPLGEMSFYPVNFKWNENIHFEWTFLVVMCQFFENLKIIANNNAWDYVDLCSKRLSICGSDGTATPCFSRKSWEFPAPLPCLITW